MTSCSHFVTDIVFQLYECKKKKIIASNMSAHTRIIIFEGLMLSIRLAIALMITDRLSSDTIRQYGQVLYQGETFTRNEVMYPQGAHRILYQILHYMRMMLLKQAILIHI